MSSGWSCVAAGQAAAVRDAGATRISGEKAEEMSPAPGILLGGNQLPYINVLFEDSRDLETVSAVDGIPGPAVRRLVGKSPATILPVFALAHHI